MKPCNYVLGIDVGLVESTMLAAEKSLSCPGRCVGRRGGRATVSLVVSRRLQRKPLLPGSELVEKGLSDLVEGAETVESLLVSIGAPRLRALGFDCPSTFADAEGRLYLLLANEDPEGAHSRYNALVRRLVSFERAAESAR